MKKKKRTHEAGGISGPFFFSFLFCSFPLCIYDPKLEVKVGGRELKTSV